MAAKLFKVILVRGGLGRRDAWRETHVDFAHALRRRLRERGAEVEIEAYDWDGQNSHGARLLAAHRLRRRLEREVEGRHDGLFVVAHGHGGMVARLAANLMTDRPRLRPDAVFALGAPFLRFTPRAVARAATVALWLLRLLVVVGLAFAVEGALPHRIGGPDRVGLALAVTAATTAPALIIAWFLDGLIRRGRTRLREAQAELVALYDPPEDRPVPFVCYRAAPDEPGLLLTIAAALGWLGRMVFATMLDALLAVLALVVGAAALYFLGQLLGPLLGLVGDPLNDWALRPAIRLVHAVLGAPAESAALARPEALPFDFALIGGLGAAALLAAAFAPAALGLGLARSRWLGFGGERPGWRLLGDVGLRRRPNRWSEIRRIFLPRAWLRGGLQHDFYLRDPRVAAEIAERMVGWRAPEPNRWRGVLIDADLLANRALRLAALAAALFAALAASVAALDGGWLGLGG